MKEEQIAELMREVQYYTHKNDISHDFYHAKRVMDLSLHLSEYESGDTDIIIPAALFHDAIVYPKNDPKTIYSGRDSAYVAQEVLDAKEWYPQDKISYVMAAIEDHSYHKGRIPETIEGKIVQDADRLEAMGAISIMRTFSSGVYMDRVFFHPDDPFCTNRDPDSLKYSFDFIYSRLLHVKDSLNTETAKKLAERRHAFIEMFEKQARYELLF
jgi:uncharacterized protein